MTEDLIIDLFISPRKMNRALIETIVNACISTGSEYDVEYGIGNVGYSKQNKMTLNEAITEVSNYRGLGCIYFRHEGLATYQLAIRPEKNKESKLGRISLSVYGGNFTDESKGPVNAITYINIAKSIWNILDKKPIYGYGDDLYDLPFHATGSSSKYDDLHPSDDEILSYNIPINRFWLNFYGKEMVEKFGRKKLEEGAYKVEEIDNGVLVITDVVPKAYKGGWGKTEEQKKAEIKGFMKGVEKYLKKRKSEHK